MSSLAKKLQFVGALTAIVLGAFIVATAHYGGLQEVLQLPATLDPLSASSQNGFALVAVSRGRPDDADFVLPNGAKMFLAGQQSSGDTILWIAPPVLPPTRLLRATTALDSTRLQSFFRVWAVSSTGDRFRLPWHYEGGCLEDGGEPCFDTRTASISPHIIAAVIPSGYSSTVTYFNVSISDPYRHTATWRLSHLPQMVASSSGESAAYDNGGIHFSLDARRFRAAPNSGEWPIVKLSMTIGQLPSTTAHKWALIERREFVPALTWQPRLLPWMNSTSNQYNRRLSTDYWMFDHERTSTDQFAAITSPYAGSNDTATFLGVLSEYETRTDSVHLKDVTVDTVRAYEAGFPEETYCIDLPHHVQLLSGSGLTFDLPKQHLSQKKLIYMSEESLNILWHLTPVTPGRNTDTAAMLPDSPLCRKYNRPVSVWFEATADGKELGVCAGLLDTANTADPTMVHFPILSSLPHVIHDLNITIHQQVDLDRIPIALTASIKDTPDTEQ